MRVDPFYSVALTSSLNDLTGQENSLSSQLSSGLRVQVAGDDPLAASEGVKLGSAIARDDAYVKAASNVQSRLQVADSALGSVVTQVTAAISATVEGLNGTLTSDNLKAIGQQLAGIRDEVVSLANSSYAGGYLFSGTSGVQPYAVDNSTTPATTAYAGNDGQQSMQTPGGQTIVTAMSGSAIFSAGGADLLGSLNALIAEFNSGSTSADAQNELETLRSGLTNVTAQRGKLDASLSAVQQTSTYAATDQTNLMAHQSTLVATDSAGVATALSQNETQQKALLSVISTVGKSNLFDYLQS